jgi:hypothetical protein
VWYPTIAGDRQRTCYTWNNFEIHSRLETSFGFLATSAEKKWVAAFESNDNFLVPGFFYQESIYLWLGHRMPTCKLANRYYFCSRFGKH